MPKSALLVLGLGAILGCAPGTDSPSEPAPNTDEPPSLADEASRTDLGCTSEEETREAREPLSGLTLGCLALVGFAIHLGCDEGLLDGWCPHGTVKRVYDTMDKAKYVDLNCTTVRTLLCSSSATVGGERLRRYCLAL